MFEECLKSVLAIAMEGTRKPSFDYHLDKPGKVSLELNLEN